MFEPLNNVFWVEKTQHTHTHTHTHGIQQPKKKEEKGKLSMQQEKWVDYLNSIRNYIEKRDYSNTSALMRMEQKPLEVLNDKKNKFNVHSRIIAHSTLCLIKLFLPHLTMKMIQLTN